MATLLPFRALRPVDAAAAAAVIAPPYDVVDVPEARALAAGRPESFLHVTRPEIDLPPGAGAGDVHTAGRAALDRLVADGVLTLDARPALAVYRLRRGAAVQTGVVGLASVAEYRAGTVAVHEHTRPDKEDDRTAHLVALAAHDEPVFLMYVGRPEIDAIVAAVTAAAPDVDLDDHEGVRHTLWMVADPERALALQTAFEAVGRLYVADGHHRSAAAARANDRLGGSGTAAFPVVAFPAGDLTVLPYQRVVTRLPDGGADALLAAIGASFDLGPARDAGSDPAPARHGFALYVAGRWHPFAARPGTVDEDDPVGRLDVALLQDRLLAPVFGITDPRTDPRVGFVGGSRGTAELERLVDTGAAAVAVALHPTSPADVMRVADAGRVMPPKSTWFDPKLASGLFVHPFA